MTHEQIEQLLGAYALDATEPQERREVEAHLAQCPRCREEVAAHLEVAALLGSAGAEAPAGLWEKIAGSLATGSPGAPATPSPALAPVADHRPEPRRPARRWSSAIAWAAAAAAAVVVALLGTQVAQLHSQVRALRTEVAAASLKGAEVEASAGPHETINLVLADKRRAATVIVEPSGAAYWEWSALPNLPSSLTYQLWGLTRGKPVSIALVGPAADEVDYFRVEASTTELMVTAEPRGGTPLPTTSVLAEGAVPSSAVS